MDVIWLTRTYTQRQLYASVAADYRSRARAVGNYWDLILRNRRSGLSRSGCERVAPGAQQGYGPPLVPEWRREKVEAEKAAKKKALSP